MEERWKELMKISKMVIDGDGGKWQVTTVISEGTRHDAKVGTLTGHATSVVMEGRVKVSSIIVSTSSCYGYYCKNEGKGEGGMYHIYRTNSYLHHTFESRRQREGVDDNLTSNSRGKTVYKRISYLIHA